MLNRWNFLKTGFYEGINVVIKLVGTGVAMDADGHVLTSYEVVKDAQAIDVTLDTGESLPAELIGRDRVTGVAVIKVEDSGLEPPSFGDPSAIAIGDEMVAIGYEFRGEEPVISRGMLTLTDSF